MARVLVTGANGHIGANTLRSLIRRGHQVVPFVRQGADLRGIQKLGLKYHYGDVQYYPALAQAAQGCDAIIHHAAVYRMWVKNPQHIIEPAIEGTRNIFKVASANQIKRVVFTSSMAAVGYPSKPGALLTTDRWNAKPHTAYYIAKTESERLAVELSEEYAIPTVRLLPTHVTGPYDYRLTPSTKGILDFINGSGTSYEGGSNYVHVEDVAEAHVAALEKGEPGERYFVGGDNLHMKELTALVHKLTGVQVVHLGITGPVAVAVGWLMGAFSSLQGKEPPYDHHVVQDVVGKYAYFDTTPSNQVLGIQPRGAEEVLADTIRWLLFLGKIKKSVARQIADRFKPDPQW